MFCPLCKAEYREGFTRCTDCDVDLVSQPPPQPRRAEWPGQSRQSRFLAWFLPMAGFYLLILVAMGHPAVLEHPLVVITVAVLILVGNIGGLWMLYQSVRYEERHLKYALLSFLPFMFMWYYLERYRTREGSERTPVAMR